MKTIAFWNRKGGTGKTTTAGNAAAELRHYGDVLLVDADPQGNLSSWLAPADFQYELADVLAGSADITDAIVPVRDRLNIIPTFTNGDLRQYAQSKLFSEPFAFANLRDEAGRLGYDFLVFDLGPGDSVLEMTATAACDEVVIVAAPEYFAADGVAGAVELLLEHARKRRAEFRHTKLVANRTNGAYAAHKAYLEQFQGAGWHVYTIGQSTAIHAAQEQRQSIFEFDPGNRYTSEYQRLATELR